MIELGISTNGFSFVTFTNVQFSEEEEDKIIECAFRKVLSRMGACKKILELFINLILTIQGLSDFSSWVLSYCGGVAGRSSQLLRLSDSVTVSYLPT